MLCVVRILRKWYFANLTFCVKVVFVLRRKDFDYETNDVPKICIYTYIQYILLKNNWFVQCYR